MNKDIKDKIREKHGEVGLVKAMALMKDTLEKIKTQNLLTDAQNLLKENRHEREMDRKDRDIEKRENLLLYQQKEQELKESVLDYGKHMFQLYMDVSKKQDAIDLALHKEQNDREYNHRLMDVFNREIGAKLESLEATKETLEARIQQAKNELVSQYLDYQDDIFEEKKKMLDESYHMRLENDRLREKALDEKLEKKYIAIQSIQQVVEQKMRSLESVNGLNNLISESKRKIETERAKQETEKARSETEKARHETEKVRYENSLSEARIENKLLSEHLQSEKEHEREHLNMIKQSEQADQELKRHLQAQYEKDVQYYIKSGRPAWLERKLQNKWRDRINSGLIDLI